MKRLILPLACAALALMTPGCSFGPKGGLTSEKQINQQRDAVERVVQRVGSTIVRIKVVEPEYYGGREEKMVSFGSGTIISPDGYILTNHHVAGKAVQLMVTMPDREEIPAHLVGTDAATDIAIIKLDPADKRTFPTTPFGDSDTVQVGDAVVAMGCPGAISQSVTLGIVSNTAIITPESWGQFELDGEVVGRLVRWIGHDAAIYPGNSGGPLVNLNGEIVGVNEIGIGLGGAIPGNIAKKVAEEIIRKGYVSRSYVGVNLQPLLKSSPVKDGVLVGSVLDESPAKHAGIEVGDILQTINGQKVEGRFGEDLPAINNLIANLPIGSEIPFEVHRDGETKTISVTTEERQPTLVPEQELREWGITARDVTLWTQLDLALRQKGGVIVTSTSSGGAVSQAKPDIKAGDIITSVNGTSIKTLGELVAFTKGIINGKEEKVPVLVTYQRDDEEYLTVVDVGIEKLPEPGREVRKAWLPIETQPLTRELAKQLKMPDTKGVRITRIYGDRPEDFPLEVGDIITKVDGDELDVSKVEDSEVFETLLRMYPRGQEVDFAVIRDGDTVDVKTKLLETPKKAREMDRYRDIEFEFVVREATYNDHEKPTLADAEFSVIADSVTNGGWANLSGLQVGDAILQIDGQKIDGARKVEDVMKEVRKKKEKEVVFLVRRDTQTIFLEMEPSW